MPLAWNPAVQCTVLLLDATHTTDPHHLGRSICTYSMVGGERELAGLPIFLGYAGMFCNIEYLHKKNSKWKENNLYFITHNGAVFSTKYNFFSLKLSRQHDMC